MKYASLEASRRDFVVMKALYESAHGLQPYTLLKRSKLSAELFFKVFSSLVSKGLVFEEQSLIFLTADGRSVFMAGSGRVLAGKKEWRKVPSGMCGKIIEPDEFYVPNAFLFLS